MKPEGPVKPWEKSLARGRGTLPRWTAWTQPAMSVPGDAAWIPAAMRPASELCSGEQAHTFTRGLALAHLDASLDRGEAAARFLADDVEAALAARGVGAFAYPG